MEETKEQVATEEQPKEQKISQQEIDRRQAQLHEGMKKQVLKLKTQAEYERLRRQIAEDRLKEFNYTTTLNMLIAKTQEGLVETPEELVKAQGGEVPEEKESENE